MANKFDPTKYKYDHIGIIVDKPKEGGRYFPEFKVWTSNPEESEFKIEWICWDPDCEVHPLIRTVAHVAFRVENLQEAIKGRKILWEPCLFEGIWMAFIEDDGAPVELFQPEK